MMDRQFIPLEDEHLDNIETGPGLEMFHLTKHSLKAHSKAGLAYIVDDKIVCCFGIIEIWEKSCEWWLVPCKDFDKYGITLLRIIKRYIDDYLNIYHRMQVVVRADIEKNIRFSKILGFEEEGLMRKYDAFGNDYYIMSKIR